MNVHDSERLAGLLEAAGYQRAADGADADVVVFNTCAVRENADNKLYGNLSHLAPRKQADPDMQIAVGGCLAQKDRDAVLRRAPWVDVVFGTHNIGSLPTLLDRARHNQAAQVEIVESLAGVPVRRCPPRANPPTPAWVSISVGCNNTCTFCIVPALRGKEVDRRPGDILAEVAVAGRPGRARGDAARARTSTPTGSRSPTPTSRATAARSRNCCAPAGASTVWSGCGSPRRIPPSSPTTSSRRWPRRRMSARRCTCRCSPAPTACCGRCAGPTAPSATSASSTGCGRRCPHAAITTDIIVGFPGETEEDFAGHPRRGGRGPVLRSAFTFQYSKRPGTPAAELRRPAAESRCAGTLSAADRPAGARSRWRRTRAQIGRTVELLVAAGEGRKDAQHRPDVAAAPATAGWCTSRPAGADIRPGDVVTTIVTDAAPHHLIADGAVLHPPAHPGRRRARSRRATPHGVGLGMPGVGVPASQSDRVRMCPVTARRRAERRLRRVQGRHRGRRTPRGAAKSIPGARALVVAILVFVLLLTFVLPHTGDARGFDVLVGDDTAIGDGIALPSRVFSLAGAGVRRRLLDAGAADPALGAGVDRAGRFDGGVASRDCSRCGRGRPRPRTASRARASG